MSGIRPKGCTRGGRPCLKPVRDARPKFGEEEEGSAATENGDSQKNRPRIFERGSPQQGRAHDVNGCEQWIEEGQRVHPGAQRFRRPEDWRNEEDDLNEVYHDLRHVAIASTDHSEKDTDPDAVDREDDERRDNGYDRPSEMDAEQD